MRYYLVGGAVRDKLLGRPIADRDYVVVGSTPAQMLAAGYKAVGGRFPVFLHPQTKDEYALARVEAKVAAGYQGFVCEFSPQISLQQDLARRDLTINAIAQDHAGTLIDPYGGQNDLKARRLRHVSPAFAEDPVRVLRVARLAAQLPEFSVAPETLKLMQDMVRGGETRSLVPERVWQELALGLAAPAPTRMITVFQTCGLLQEILPELAALQGVAQSPRHHPEGDAYIHTLMTVQAAGALNLSPEEIFAALLHDVGKAQTPRAEWPVHYGHEARSKILVEKICTRWRVPRRFSQLALLAAAEHGNVHNSVSGGAPGAVDLLGRLQAWQSPQLAHQVINVSEADYAYAPARRGTRYPQGTFLRQALAAITREVNPGVLAQEILAGGGDGTKIKQALRGARISVVEQLLHTHRAEFINTYHAPEPYDSGRGLGGS